MAALDDLASKLFGSKRAESNIVSTDATTRTYVGTATSASEDGSVYVTLSQDVTLPDDDDGTHGLGVEMPTTVNVDEGDEVIVTVFGGGTMKAPVVTGNPGWGDRMQAQVDSAEALAQQAEDVAQEAAEEVEQVRQDVADFRDDVATTYATKVERQDGDDAVRTFITTNYTNSNDLATTYATKTLVSQTKDAIELAASQTYETQSDAAATYATKAALTVGLDGIRSEVAEDYQPKGDYATTASMNSAIQQSATSIESTVAAMYTTKAEFEGLQVGGTNLLLGTEDWSGCSVTIGTVTSGTKGGGQVLTYTKTTTSGNNDLGRWNGFGPLEADEDYTLSFWAKADQACEFNSYLFGWSPSTCTKANSSQGATSTATDGAITSTLSTEWQRYWVTFHTASPQGATNNIICVRPRNLAANVTTYYVASPKLERGTLATDWSPAPEDITTTYATKTEVQQTASGLDTRITTAQLTADGALSDSVEYIVGTQTAATNAWTGVTRDAALVAGKTIAYKLPYAGNSSAATLNLTLSGGGTTGAKGVRRMADNNANYTVTTQYGAGAVLQMTYDGEYWRVSSGYNPSTDINNARYRTQLPNAIKAAAAYTGGHFICGTSEGYRNIGAGVAFDLGYPLLYATANVAAGATGTGNYLEFEGRTASNNGTIQSGGANKTLYLKGTVSGNTFTIAASPFMTTVTPTSEDGYCYIPLGLMYSATNIYFQSSDQLYAYTEGAFQPIGRGALATAQAEVTERQTLIRQFSGGVLAGYVGNAIAALVNAAGSFDVVRTAWSDGVPSILGTLARYAASGISLFDAAGNVLAEFASDHVRIGGAIPEDGSAVATVCFFDSDADKGAMVEGYVSNSYSPTDEDVGWGVQTQDTYTDLHTSTNDSDMEQVNGCAGTADVRLGQTTYWEDGPDGYYQAESTATLIATADGGTDPTQTAHASASLGVKAVTVNDDYERSYLTVNGNDIPTRQAIVGLTQPEATYTGTNDTYTATANGWTISHMNNVQGESSVSNYFTFSNGVITALRDELLEISGVAYWNSGAVGQYGFGFFIGSSTVNSGSEKSVFSYKASASGQFSVTMPPRCVPVTAGTKIAVGRYSINGSVYRNGTNFSFVTIRVVQDRSGGVSEIDYSDEAMG